MRIHCIGIAGIGLSGLARLLQADGHLVTGCDLEHTEIVDELIEDGIDVKVEHKEIHISKDIDKVVYSTAVPLTNVELLKAKELGITVETYAEALHEFVKQKFIIAITGTHGKTTTTAMTSLAFLEGKKDPTILIGSKLPQLNDKNSKIGDGKHFIVEACEYHRNFLQFYPDVVVLTNIEAEHLDYFKDLEDYKGAYKEFISQIRDGGYVVANYDDENVKDVVKDFDKKVIYFASEFKEGINMDLWYLKEDKIFLYKAEEDKHETFGELKLSVPGDFNKMNALASFVTAYEQEVTPESAFKALLDFKGTWRRMEELGEFEEITVVSDYGHHPTEIKVTLEALKEKYNVSNICVIYQPHQYNRTKHFLNDFPGAFKNNAKYVIVPDIYKVRDKKEDIEEVSDLKLVEKIKEANVDALHIESYEGIAKFIKEQSSNIDLIVVMGAGDIYELAYFLTR